MKILILDNHCNAALACIQSLGHAGHDIYIAGAQKPTLSQYSKYSKTILQYPAPLKHSEAFVLAITQWQSKFEFDFILPVTDNTIYPLMTVEDISLQKVLILPNDKSFNIAFNKEKTLLLAKSLNIPVPNNTYVTTDTFNKQNFKKLPLFIKPIHSKGSSKNGTFNLQPILVKTQEKLNETVNQFLRHTPVQIQQCVPGIGIGIEVLCENGRIIRAFAHQRIHEIPLTGGGSSYRKSIPMPEILYKHSEQLMHALKWHGVAMVEFKSEKDQHWLMEINGRFWGSLPLALHAGIDFPSLLIKMLAGQNIAKEYNYNTNLYVRNISKDIDWFKLNIKADKSNTQLITHNTLKSFFELFRALWGRERWDHASIHDVKPIFRQLYNIVKKEILTLKNKMKKWLVLKNAKTLELPKKNKKILVMCYGNICRSPYVERLLNDKLKNNGFSIQSAGFHEKINRTSPLEHQKRCLKHGVDLSHHMSKLINTNLIEWADIILLMDYKNRESMVNNFNSSALRKCRFLGAYTEHSSNIEIIDPYNKNEAESIKIIKHMNVSCNALVANLIK